MRSVRESNNNNGLTRRAGTRAAWIGLAAWAIFSSAAALADGDADRGKQLSATCAACHGADGNSINAEWPTLAGQNEQYLIRALHSFQQGSRENVLMSSQAANLSDQDIEDLAAYYSQQRAKRLTADPALVTEGERLYRGGDSDKGISACIGCHGPTGRGNPGAGYPVLASQHALYTSNQLQAFRAGKRKSDAALGGMMRDIAGLMTNDEIKAVSSYVQGLQ